MPRLECHLAERRDGATTAARTGQNVLGIDATEQVGPREPAPTPDGRRTGCRATWARRGGWIGISAESLAIEIAVTIPATSLRVDEADPIEVGQMGESFLSPKTAHRLSCDAGVVEAIEDEHGVPLSVGRKRRTIAGALKRALNKRDKTCTYPGCTHRLFLERHHIQHWAEGGETSLSNTALLCSQHRRHVHEYGYTIVLDADGRPQFRDPHGRLVAAVPPPPTWTDLGWPRMRAANEALAIKAHRVTR